MGSRLADLLVTLGYPSGADLGYQTFLYGNEKELRQIFMFLIDKLPKEREEEADANIGDCYNLRSVWSPYRL